MTERGAVLVTGGAGYVGSHTCKALARAGYLPVTYDNLGGGHRWAVRWGPLELGDVLDGARLGAVIGRYRPVAAMHFAALIVVGESVAHPAKYFRNNADGTRCLVETLIAQGVKRIVFSSSAAVYGEPVEVPIPETHPTQPVNPYGHSKLMAEKALRECAAAHGMRFASLRYFNAAGADPQGETGEAHEPETHAIPLAVTAALAGAQPFEIFGTDYPTPDGTAVRDYVHVSDLAAAHLRALEHLTANSESLVLNLGTGRGHSVRQVVAAVEHVSGRILPIEERPRRPGDAPVLVADPSRSKEALGWAPAHTSLQQIVETAWNWHRMRRGESA